MSYSFPQGQPSTYPQSDITRTPLIFILTLVETTGPFRRNKDIWGRDADEFRPERWFEMSEKRETSFGVYGNLCGMYSDDRNLSVS